MPVCNLVHLNGAFLPFGEACVSPLDRGFLFSHAAYEVTAVFAGRCIDLDGHIGRLQRTLSAIGIDDPLGPAGWRQLHQEMIDRNTLSEGLIYLQVSAGAYEARDFAGPDVFSPTIFAFADEKPLITPSASDGIAAVFSGDIRWKRRDLKTTQLLSQALAYRQAKEKGAATAFMVEDGFVTEAASANAWLVTRSGEIVTRALSEAILPGITRDSIMRMQARGGFAITERAFTPDEALDAAEIFTSSAGALIAPVIRLEGRAVGDGRPGRVTRHIQRLYYEAMGVDLASRAAFVFDRS